MLVEEVVAKRRQTFHSDPARNWRKCRQPPCKLAEYKRCYKSINLLEGANWVWQVENEVHFLAARKLKWLLLQNSMNIKITSDSSVTESRKLLQILNTKEVSMQVSHIVQVETA